MAGAPERLYYFLLLSSEAGDGNAWASWLSQGFDFSVREAPPSVPREKRVQRITHPEPRRFWIELEGGDDAVMTRVRQVLSQLESLREDVRDKDPLNRAAMLRADTLINRVLISPVERALERAKLRSDEVGTISRALDRSLTALTDPDIIAVEVR